MILLNDPNKPLFVQIAEMIEDQILNNTLLVGEQVYSTNQLAKLYSINPATARKGLNILVDEDIIYKKRGLGMFVSDGAVNIILNKRKDSFYNEFVIKMIEEAKKLNISQDELVDMIKNRRGDV